MLYCKLINLAENYIPGVRGFLVAVEQLEQENLYRLSLNKPLNIPALNKSTQTVLINEKQRQVLPVLENVGKRFIPGLGSVFVDTVCFDLVSHTKILALSQKISASFPFAANTQVSGLKLGAADQIEAFIYKEPLLVPSAEITIQEKALRLIAELQVQEIILLNNGYRLHLAKPVPLSMSGSNLVLSLGRLTIDSNCVLINMIPL
ncbi:hypothetical protein NO1_2068 [Candidatus Termititenax aidoneus]|uniref:Uncharacterized protein n=1 Tax=Termititenax aidoneus TaxID=2218524 RepID=A0A388TDI0_TERA1|nr:hypothetical protein NO1_2068 [Candidatus Termititenax aidoneus]